MAHNSLFQLAAKLCYFAIILNPKNNSQVTCLASGHAFNCQVAASRCKKSGRATLTGDDQCNISNAETSSYSGLNSACSEGALLKNVFPTGSYRLEKKAIRSIAKILIGFLEPCEGLSAASSNLVLFLSL